METTEVERFRKILVEQRDHVRQQLVDAGANPDEDKLESVNFDFGFADSAQSTAEQARVLAMIEGLRTELRDIDAALVRIEKGTFGTCERCGQPIEPERLEALPRTRLCVGCKQKGP